MRRIVIITVLATAPFAAQSQTQEELEAMMQILGVASMEEADAEEIEILMDILKHPVRINYADRRTLQSCGLFTDFQTASLLDYRLRHGYVMSMTELAAVDGFSDLIVRRLSPFISLEGNLRRDGDRAEKMFGCELNARTTLKMPDDGPVGIDYAARGRIEYKDNLRLTLAKSASSYSAGLAFSYRNGSIIAGDFNARFAQGLCLWNTMTINTLSSPAAFMRRPSGVSQSFSFTGNYAMTGVAGDIVTGRWKISYLVNLPGIKKIPVTKLVLDPCVNVTRYFRFGHVGFTHVTSVSTPFSKAFRLPVMRTSADFSICIRGLNVFGEAMADWVNSNADVIAGMETTLWENLTVATLARRLVQKGEHGWAASGEYKHDAHQLILSSDVLYRSDKADSAEDCPIQVKGQVRWRCDLTTYMYMEVKAAERFRTWGKPFRTDVRLDIHADIGDWAICGRLNALKCDGIGLLGYAEGSYAWDSRSRVYIRTGAFRIDDWDDRIYVYERDAPGSFNVPAYYGRGFWISTYLKWRIARWGSLYFRGAYKKPGKAELKFQLTLHL